MKEMKVHKHNFTIGNFGPTTAPLCQQCGLSEQAETHVSVGGQYAGVIRHKPDALSALRWTKVWTNHGEPQPLDDKHFGVALQTEAETDATRQAKATHPGWRNSRVRSFVSDLRAKNNELQLELIQARLERGQFRKERDEWKREFLIASDWRHRFQAQRDELLAAIRDMMHDLDLFYGKYRSSDNKYLANLKTAIANASK